MKNSKLSVKTFEGQKIENKQLDKLKGGSTPRFFALGCKHICSGL